MRFLFIVRGIVLRIVEVGATIVIEVFFELPAIIWHNVKRGAVEVLLVGLTVAMLLANEGDDGRWGTPKPEATSPTVAMSTASEGGNFTAVG